MLLNLIFGTGGTIIDPLIPIAVLAAIGITMKVKNKKTAVSTH